MRRETAKEVVFLQNLHRYEGETLTRYDSKPIETTPVKRGGSVAQQQVSYIERGKLWRISCAYCGDALWRKDDYQLMWPGVMAVPTHANYNDSTQWRICLGSEMQVGWTLYHCSCGKKLTARLLIDGKRWGFWVPIHGSQGNTKCAMSQKWVYNRVQPQQKNEK